MPTITNNFSAYHLEPWQRVKEAIADMLIAEEELSARGNPLFARLYKYIKPIAGVAGQEDANSALLGVQHELIRYLDCGAVWNWLENPEEKNVRDVLTVQLAMIAAAVTEINITKPYATEEVKQILAGDQTAYNDIFFINTLRQALTAPAGDAVLPGMLANSLPAIKTESAEADILWWDDAFIKAMMLQVIWKNFANLRGGSQQFMAENYYYAGIVAGVPMFKIVKEVVGAGGDAIRLRLIRALENNREIIPLSVSGQNGEYFGELGKKYVAGALSAEIPTLAQEKFIEKYYKNEPSGEQYAAWLRAALSALFRLKKGDL